MSKSEVNKYQIGGDHYTSMTVQPWDIISTWPHEQQIGFFKGNALKYLLRAGKKGSATEDIQKAIHYLDKLNELLNESLIDWVEKNKPKVKWPDLKDEDA